MIYPFGPVFGTVNISGADHCEPQSVVENTAITWNVPDGNLIFENLLDRRKRVVAHLNYRVRGFSIIRYSSFGSSVENIQADL